MNEKKSEIIFYGNLNGKNIQGYAYSVYGIGGEAPTITANAGGGHMPYILIEWEEEDEKVERHSGV